MKCSDNERVMEAEINVRNEIAQLFIYFCKFPWAQKVAYIMGIKPKCSDS